MTKLERKLQVGTEACKPVGILLLHKFSEKYGRKSPTLYCDNGLAIFTNVSRPASEKTKIFFSKFIRELDFELTIQCNRKTMNFLDAVLNLEDSSYRPYLKDKNKKNYVNTESNHPLSIVKQLSKSIEQRLSQLSANEEVFKNSIKPFKEAIAKARYKNEM